MSSNATGLEITNHTSPGVSNCAFVRAPHSAMCHASWLPPHRSGMGRVPNWYLSIATVYSSLGVTNKHKRAEEHMGTVSSTIRHPRLWAKWLFIAGGLCTSSVVAGPAAANDANGTEVINKESSGRPQPAPASRDTGPAQAYDQLKPADTGSVRLKAPSAPVPPVFPYFYINDNRLTFAYLPDGATPNFPGKSAGNGLAFTHYDQWAYGTNLVNLGLIKFGHHSGGAACTVPYQGCSGQDVIFAHVRSTLGFNQVFNTKAFSFGPLRNVSFEAGADFYVQNNTPGTASKGFMGGLQFAFDLPYKGHFEFSPLVYKMVNYSGFLAPYIADGNLNFHVTWAFDASYYMPLGFLPETIPLAISGRVQVVGPGGFGYAPGQLPPGLLPTSKTQILTEPIRLTLDASKLFWGARYSHAVDVWVAYKYSQNLLGADHNLARGCIGGACTLSSVFTGLSLKF